MKKIKGLIFLLILSLTLFSGCSGDLKKENIQNNKSTPQCDEKSR